MWSVDAWQTNLTYCLVTLSGRAKATRGKGEGIAHLFTNGSPDVAPYY